MSLKLLTLFLAAQAFAKTDIAGCVSSEVSVTQSSGAVLQGQLIWYVPDTGEICELLDCGGGRAPPKTTVPGCAAYEGTETYSPKFLPSSTSTSAETTATGGSEITSAPGGAATGGADKGAGAGSGGTQTSGGGAKSSTQPGAAAATGGRELLGSCLIAGVAMGLGMI